MGEEKEPNFEELGLCSHAQLPGICKECLKTESGLEKQLEIHESAKGIGNKLANELEEETGIQPYDVTMVLGAGF